MKQLALIALCAMLLGGGMAYGATFGNTSSGTTYNHSIEASIKGTQFALSEAGVATSITAYLTVGTNATLVRCMLYHGEDSSLIAVTEMQMVPVQTATATTFNFNYTVNLAAGNYFIAAWANATAGTCFLGRNLAGGGDQSFEDTEGMVTYPPDPYISSAAYNTYLYRIYCTYTAGTQLTLGRTTIGAASLTIIQQIAGGIFTTPATAISVSSITPHLAMSTAAGEEDTVMCAIYKQSDLSLVDTTYQIRFYGDTAISGGIRLWREFDFPTDVTLAASTDYVWVAWGGHFSSSNNLRLDLSGGQGVESDPETFDGTFPNPMADNTVANWYASIFVDYTEVVGGINGRRRKIIMGEPLGLVREATETFAGEWNALVK